MSAEVEIPAPVGGWNARDALANMEPTDAVTLINWVPDNGVVRGRGGSLTKNTPVAFAIQSLMPYAGDTSNALLAAYNGHIYVVANDTGFIAPASLVAGMTSNKWQYCGFDTNLVMMNGADHAKKFNGTILSDLTVTQLATPVNAAFTPGAGTLASASYSYRVSAINDVGESLASTATALVIVGPAGVNVNWGAVTGASGYKVYGRTAGSELLIATVGAVTTYLDSGAITPSGALPSTNTSAVDPTTLIGAASFKGRAYYWQASSQTFWYAEAGAFQGVLHPFDLSTFTSRGGIIKQLVSWTRDAGDGVDDMFVIIFSTGETIIYQGDDPANTNQWSMIGKYSLGAPLGVRAHCRFASTEIILTDDGFVGLDEAIQNARTQIVDTFGGRIVRAAKSAAKTDRANFGWEALYYPDGNWFIANVPISATQSVQYVKNTNSGAWTQFTGWNATTFCVFKDRLYFATPAGEIKLANVTSTDTVTNKPYSDDGLPISYEALTAYVKLGAPGLKSAATVARVIMSLQDGNALSLNTFVDYQVKSLPALLTPVEQVVGQWDVSSWDEDYWGGPNEQDPGAIRARAFFRPITGFGFAIAMNVRTRSVIQNPVWFSMTYVYKQAGVN